LIINRPGALGVSIRTAKTNYVFDLELDEARLADLSGSVKEVTTFHINQQSLRGAELTANNRPRLLMLGDSITFGYYVNDAESYPAVLQTKLPQYQVLNAGVSSYNAEEEWQYLKKYGPLFQPQVVGIGFYLNDIFSLGRPLMVKEYNFFFPYRKIPFLWRFSNQSRLLGLVYERLLTLPAFSDKTVDEKRPENVSIEYAWSGYEKLLNEISEYAVLNDIKLFLVIFPNAFQLNRPASTAYYQKRLLEITRKLEIPTLDLYPAFSKSKVNLYQSNDTIHPNALDIKSPLKKSPIFYPNVLSQNQT